MRVLYLRATTPKPYRRTSILKTGENYLPALDLTTPKMALFAWFCARNAMKKRMPRILGWWVLTLLPAGQAVHAQQPNYSAMKAPVKAAAVDGNSKDQFAPTERNPRYRISRSDVLSLSFPLSPELNQTVTVRPDGFITLEGAGEIRIEGLTVPEVVEVVKRTYASMLHDPIVDVDLVDFQKPFFTVTGQVGKPGQYELRADTTVSQALAVAGGLASTAKTQVFLYRAVSSNWAEVRELKLKDFLNGKNISEDVSLRPGDMIFVPETKLTKFRKYVPYSVGITSPYPATF